MVKKAINESTKTIKKVCKKLKLFFCYISVNNTDIPVIAPYGYYLLYFSLEKNKRRINEIFISFICSSFLVLVKRGCAP